MHDLNDPEHARQKPLDLGDYLIPLSGLIIPESLRNTTTSSSSDADGVWDGETDETFRIASVQQHYIALSPMSNVLVEKVQPAPTAPAHYYGLFSADLPQFLKEIMVDGRDRIARPVLAAVTVSVVTNSNDNSNQSDGLLPGDDCTSLYRVRLMGPPGE